MMVFDRFFLNSAALFAASMLCTMSVSAQSTEQENIVVIGVTPTQGGGLSQEVIPYNVQSVSADELENNQSLDITDYMNRNFNSVNINDAQNNPLQPDIQYRGFTASPLLGLPQGIAVYQNGVRVNEIFGDTINWDLIPESSIANMDLIGGANPVFGLNTLGGAVSIQTKNGFTHEGNSFEIYGGPVHDRFVLSAESGGNNGKFGYYGTFQYFDEEGWRDASPSDSLNVFAALSYRDGDTTSLDLNINYGDTDLIGNGAIPIELANQDREAIFTSPDQTENQMYMFQLQGEHWMNDIWQIAGNAFYRRNETDTFNGDGTEFEECTIDGDEVLAEIDEDAVEDAGLDCDAGVTSAQLAAANIDFEIVENQFGVEISDANGFEPDDFNGLNNRSDRELENYGGTLQNVFLGDLFGKENQLIVGASYTYGDVVFNSSQELAELTAERATLGTNQFVPEEGTAIDSETFTVSLYFTDTVSATDKLDLTFSGRVDHTDIEISDRGGRGFTDPQPDLNGEHEFNRFNPAVGFTYAHLPGLTSYFSYSESSRAPTAVELACAEPDAPCSLPNGFLADPPLEQVVAKSFEGGFRGYLPDLGIASDISWEVGAFLTTNNDDIIFQNTGGVSGNEGFFDNIGDTERLGMELGLRGDINRFSWFLNYSYVRATFQDSFESSSANNPSADANGLIQVSDGDFIPGIPEHTFKVGGDYEINSRLTIGGDLLYNSGVFLRGDESNQLGRLDGYATVNLRGSYQVNNVFSVFARINNLFDEEYESFGLLGEPDEVPGFDSFTDNRFVGVGAPLSGFVGVRANF